MNVLTKVLVVITTVLAVIFVAMVVSFVARVPNYAKSYDDIKRELNESLVERAAEAKKARLANALENKDNQDLRAKIAEYEIALGKAEQESNDLRTSLASESKTAAALKQSVENLTDVIAKKDDRVEIFRQAKQMSDTKFKEIAQENKSLMDRAGSLARELALAETELKYARENAVGQSNKAKELLIRVQSLSALLRKNGLDPDKDPVLAADGAIQGVVKEVEIISPNYILVSVSVGERDGVSKGMEFTVSSGDTWKGDIEIISVKPDISVGKMVRGTGVAVDDTAKRIVP